MFWLAVWCLRCLVSLLAHVIWHGDVGAGLHAALTNIQLDRHEASCSKQIVGFIAVGGCP
jgi:hypothetical protein